MIHILPPSPRLREQTATVLAPFFMIEGQNDLGPARDAAAALLDEYKAMTPKDLQLAAQIVAFDFAVLACLGASMTVGKQDLDAMLDLQDSALALDRLSEKSTKALNARRRERAKAPHLMSRANTEWDNAGFQAAIGRAMEKMLYANSKMTGLLNAAPTPQPPVEKPEKLPIRSAEPMTLTALARLGKEAEAELGFRNMWPTPQ